MLRKIKSLIEKFLDFRSSKEIVKKITTKKGGMYLFRRNSTVHLAHGSTREDIVLAENVRMLGTLHSENNGKIIMGNNTKLGLNSKVVSSDRIVIGDYTAIADNVTIVDNNSHPVNPVDRRFMRLTPSGSKFRGLKYSDSAPVIIGENCWIGEFSRVLKGVKIGNNSIVAANAVVTKDVPENCIAAGNPARIVKIDIDKLPRYFDNKI